MIPSSISQTYPTNPFQFLVGFSFLVACWGFLSWLSSGVIFLKCLYFVLFYKGNTVFIKIYLEVSLYFQFFQKLYKGLELMQSFKIELISETIRTCVFLYWECLCLQIQSVHVFLNLDRSVFIIQTWYFVYFFLRLHVCLPLFIFSLVS